MGRVNGQAVVKMQIISSVQVLRSVVKCCIFWHFLPLILELLTTLTETETPFSHVHSKFYLENIQLPHQEGVPGWKGWMLKFELISVCNAWACFAMQNLHFAQ